MVRAGCKFFPRVYDGVAREVLQSNGYCEYEYDELATRASEKIEYFNILVHLFACHGKCLIM